MELAVITLIALACSTVMSILAFMIGRCGRKLPIDGMLPRVVCSARFSPVADRPRPRPGSRKTQLSYGAGYLRTFSCTLGTLIALVSRSAVVGGSRLA
jgi:hypothetical protein